MGSQTPPILVVLAGVELPGLDKPLDKYPIVIVGQVQPRDGQQVLLDTVLSFTPHFVFVNGDEPAFDGIALAQVLRGKRAPIAVILVTDRQDRDFIQQAVLAGVEELLPHHCSPEQVRELMQRILVSPKGERWFPEVEIPQERPVGKVMALSSGKGGVGKTTVIVNLAIALAQETNQPVAVLDLFIGDALALVNATARMTLSEIPDAIKEIDMDLLRPYAVRSEVGVDFYTWFFSPERNLPEYIDLGRLEMVLRTLRNGYSYILIDAPVTLYVPDLELLTLADETFVIAVPWDLLSLRATKALTLGLQRWKINPQLLLNRVHPDSEVTPDFVASQLGLKIWGMIPNDTRTVVRAINSGMPAILSEPESEFAQTLRRLARKLAGLPEEQRRRRFLFF